MQNKRLQVCGRIEALYGFFSVTPCPADLFLRFMAGIVRSPLTFGTPHFDALVALFEQIDEQGGPQKSGGAA